MAVGIIGAKILKPTLLVRKKHHLKIFTKSLLTIKQLKHEYVTRFS